MTYRTIDNLIVPIRKFSLLYKYYMIFDAPENVLAKCLLQNDIDFAYTHSFASNDTHYEIRICRIPILQNKKFLKIIKTLPQFMKIHGYNDYVDFCGQFLKDLNGVEKE